MSRIIVWATPVFLVLTVLEWVWSQRHASAQGARPAYRYADTLNSISLGVLSQLVGVLARLLTVGIYGAVLKAVGAPPAAAFWSSVVGVVVALVFYDFCYYWLHRAGHRIAVCWAAHAVHHQSQHYNLSTALRQTASGVLLGWVFYLPMAAAGVPVAVFALVAMVDLLYQFWVHTEQVGRLGWFDRWFCSPSNHRVHHAVNDPYIDRNYGGILVLWDRLFGSFQEERDDTPCVYGTRTPLASWDPLWANLCVYAALARSSWQAPRGLDKLRVWFMPPEWHCPGTPCAPAFRIDALPDYNPPLTRTQQGFGALQFTFTLVAVSVFLWHADAMPWTQAALWVLALTASVWAQGLFLQSRLHLLEVLVLQCAALATVGALLHTGLYWAFKPAALALAMIFVAHRAVSTGADRRFTLLLLAALLASLSGDVFLMLPDNYFIPGLASFLVAHLFYIALLRQHTPWFASRTALVAVLATGAAVYALVLPGLGDTVLRVAVAAYVLVIALMVAQALGRAQARGDAASRALALGACVFMLSDALIAVHRFLTPLPLASLWILSTYYAAQMLIVHHAHAAHPDR